MSTFTDATIQLRPPSPHPSSSGDPLRPHLDLEEILLQARHRWLRPIEVREILLNHSLFLVTPELVNKPTSGSLFLFDRTKLPHFRKDGHNWRKKESHERLKAESVDVLHCYYARGEDNKKFHRRIYWMLEESFKHIVVVHYLEPKIW